MHHILIFLCPILFLFLIAFIWGVIDNKDIKRILKASDEYAKFNGKMVVVGRGTIKIVFKTKEDEIAWQNHVRKKFFDKMPKELDQTPKIVVRSLNANKQTKNEINN